MVDDAHWLDQPSADALAFAARRIENEAVAMLFGARDPAEASFAPAELKEAVSWFLASGRWVGGRLADRL